MQKLLLFVDKVSTWVGQAFSWLIVGAHAADLLGGVLALRARPSARVGVRRHDHDVRHAVHDGRRVHAVQERPRARRRALRLLPAAAAGRARPRRSTSCSSFPAWSRSAWAGYSYAGESWAINEHSNITADGPPIYPFKTIIPIAGAFLLLQGIVEIVRCVDLPEAGRVAVARGGRRGSRRRQAEGDGARQGRGHRQARRVRRRAGRTGAQMRKEVWFGLSHHGRGRDHACSC